MMRQFGVVDLGQDDAHPTAHADIGGLEKFLRVRLDQHGLYARWDGDPDRKAAIVVVVVGKHGKDLFTDKKGRLAVREPFAGTGKR